MRRFRPLSQQEFHLTPQKPSPMNLAKALYGVHVVIRQQRRATRPWRDVAGLSLLIVAVPLLSAAVKLALFNVPGSGQWIAPGAIAVTLLLLVAAANLGAGAAPPAQARDEVQSALITHLTPFDLCTGRLLASLFIPLIVLLLSYLFCFACEAESRSTHLGISGILTGHLVLLAAVIMIASVSLLFALQRKPGRSRVRGTACGVLIAGICIGAIFLMNPKMPITQDPSWFIQTALVINPISAVETALHKDILRTKWIYEHSTAADYQFTYPPPFASMGIFATLAVIAHSISVVRFRRAYQ